MNNLQFMPMTEPLAKAITTWIYPAPYDLYNMDDDEETLSELLDGSYYASINEEGELIGFICIGDAARVPGGYLAGIYGNEQVMDIGLGMRPDLTGRGQGEDKARTRRILFTREPSLYLPSYASFAHTARRSCFQ